MGANTSLIPQDLRNTPVFIFTPSRINGSLWAQYYISIIKVTCVYLYKASVTDLFARRGRPKAMWVMKLFNWPVMLSVGPRGPPPAAQCLPTCRRVCPPNTLGNTNVSKRLWRFLISHLRPVASCFLHQSGSSIPNMEMCSLQLAWCHWRVSSPGQVPWPVFLAHLHARSFVWHGVWFKIKLVKFKVQFCVTKVAVKQIIIFN